MLSLERILFPVDLSEQSREMVPTLRRIALRYQSEVILLHVVHPAYMVPESALWSSTIPPVPDWLLCQQAEKLEAFSKQEMPDLPVRRLVLEGEPEEQIVATAQTEQVQLVVMPTHGYGRFRKLLIGSVTSKVLHDLDGPVLTGAHLADHTQAASESISQVVCALDLGPHSRNILTWANHLAMGFRATLHLVHVTPRLDPSLKIVFSSDVQEQRDACVREEIRNLQTAVAAQSSNVCVVQGDVARSVCAYARSLRADLLVIGRGEHSGGLGRLRANAYSIIRHSMCPVLSV